MEEQLLNTKDVAELLKMSYAGVVKWRQDKKGPPYIRMGWKVGYKREDIEEWLTANTVQPSG